MRYIVDNYSRVNTIPATALYDNQGNRLMTLEESDFSQLFMAGYKFPEPFSVKAADGVTDLYGVMYKLLILIPRKYIRSLTMYTPDRNRRELSFATSR